MIMYANFVENLFKPLPLRESRIDHALIGIIGEIGEIADDIKKYVIYCQELNRENLLKELGDLLFYIQALENQYDKAELVNTYIYGTPGTFFEYVKSLNALSANLTNEELRLDSSIMMVRIIMAFARDLGYTIEEVIAANVKKLRARYPNGYSDTSAKERKDEV